MDIHANQNANDKLELLSAQRQFYNWAKRWMIVNYTFTLLIACYAPIGFVVFPGNSLATTIIGTLGAIWTVVSFSIGLREHVLISKAARIQEQFDTEVFGLDWKTTISATKVSPEEIDNACRKYRGSIEDDFGNWYVGMENVPYPQSVLMAQRQNLTWDYRLRRTYGGMLIGIILLVVISGIVVAMVSDALLSEYLIGLFLPSLAAVLRGVQEVSTNYKIAKEKEHLELHVNELLQSLKELSDVTIGQLRDIQDKIFIERCKAPLIPNTVYRFLRRRFTENAIGATKHITGDQSDLQRRN